MEFFRHCPQCGRRFHIILVDKKLAHIDKETEQSPARIDKMLVVGAGVDIGSRRPPRNFPTSAWVVEEGKPVTIYIEEFEYSYKCRHCGHAWSEERVEKHSKAPTTA